MFLSRISSAGYLSKKVIKWVTGDEPDHNEFQQSMIFKSMEGPLEAAPQLILQLYIITRAGLNGFLGLQSFEGKIKYFWSSTPNSKFSKPNIY